MTTSKECNKILDKSAPVKSLSAKTNRLGGGFQRLSLAFISLYNNSMKIVMVTTGTAWLKYRTQVIVLPIQRVRALNLHKS